MQLAFEQWTFRTVYEKGKQLIPLIHLAFHIGVTKSAWIPNPKSNGLAGNILSIFGQLDDTVIVCEPITY